MSGPVQEKRKRPVRCSTKGCKDKVWHYTVRVCDNCLFKRYKEFWRIYNG